MFRVATVSLEIFKSDCCLTWEDSRMTQTTSCCKQMKGGAHVIFGFWGLWIRIRFPWLLMAICLFLKNQLLIDNFHIFSQSNVNQRGCLSHVWQTHAIAEHVWAKSLGCEWTKWLDKWLVMFSAKQSMIGFLLDLYIYIYVCIYVCIHIYIYVYIYT